MVWVLASLVGYVVGLIVFAKKPVAQQAVMLAIFIVCLTFVGTLDLLLPLYCIAVMIPFLKKLRFLRPLTVALLFYCGCYILVGIVLQNKVATCIAFLSKIYQFIVFFLVMDSQEESSDAYQGNQTGLIGLMLLVESLLGIYLIFHGYSAAGSQDELRLVSNSQPITGNLAVALLPLLCGYYYHKRQNCLIATCIIALSAVFCAWIIVSGTRGYMLLYGLTVIPVYVDYFFVEGRRHIARVSTMAAAVFAVLFGALLTWNLADKVTSALRLKDTVGIRTYENATIWNFMNNAPLNVKLFGIGFGGTAGDYREYLDAVNQQISAGMWNASKYQTASGVLFHSLFSNVLLVQGIIGIFVLGLLAVVMWREISACCVENLRLRRALHLFLIGFLLMNYYRWAADCGIGEMIILALVLKNEETAGRGVKAVQCIDY